MPPLPRPDVSVTVYEDPVTYSRSLVVVISCHGKARSYTGRSTDAVVPTEDAIRQIIRQIIDDPRTADWLP